MTPHHTAARLSYLKCIHLAPPFLRHGRASWHLWPRAQVTGSPSRAGLAWPCPPLLSRLPAPASERLLVPLGGTVAGLLCLCRFPTTATGAVSLSSLPGRSFFRRSSDTTFLLMHLHWPLQDTVSYLHFSPPRSSLPLLQAFEVCYSPVLQSLEDREPVVLPS